MALISKILFPVDFSTSSIAMAAYVKRAAAILGARVSLVHVVNPGSYSGLELYVRPLSEVEDEHLSIGRERLDSFLTEEFSAAECSRIVRFGDPATEIAQAAREGAFDLILMPTHAGKFRQMLLGSTTAKVINDSDCPVLTSTHAETIAPRPLQHREWLCAVGLSANSERVLRFAARGASQAGARLTIIHAVQGVDPESSLVLDLKKQVFLAERKEASRRIAELQQRVGMDAPVRIEVGPLKEALLQAALQSDADALIIGRSPQPGAQGRLRDLTYAMVRDSPFPVVSV
ncbi:universal stress protein [Acidicapsa dinghuensis]|uniref:Universal stress protein n=1 Tax=Acidicapsa dinghuensis TaxID=2218256 RepID=A0ABW1EDR3_9BACT|nr:universal stress protein [Acidicapsa dinghuensis]